MSYITDFDSELVAKLESNEGTESIVKWVSEKVLQSYKNGITATLRLDVTVMPVSGQGDGKTWTFTAYGPGFTKEVANATAEERLIKQIDADTKMVLNF